MENKIVLCKKDLFTRNKPTSINRNIGFNKDKEYKIAYYSKNLDYDYIWIYDNEGYQFAFAILNNDKKEYLIEYLFKDYFYSPEETKNMKRIKNINNLLKDEI